MAQFAYDTYVSVFLVYVIYKFSEEETSAEVHDLILGKKVHATVYMKN